MDLLTTVYELAAIEEIRQLKARYFRYIDTKQWRQLAHLFTVGGSLEAEGHVTNGREAIERLLKRLLQDVATVHHGHMPEITLTGPDTATGIWAMFDYLVFPGEGPRRGIRGYGHYHEDYQRVDGAWLFRRVVLTRLRREPLEGGYPGLPPRTEGS